jgi:hypothetical protein
MQRSRASQEHETLSQGRTGESRCSLQGSLLRWPRSKNSISARSARSAGRSGLVPWLPFVLAPSSSDALLAHLRSAIGGRGSDIPSRMTSSTLPVRHLLAAREPARKEGQKAGGCPGAARSFSASECHPELGRVLLPKQGGTRTYIRLSKCITPEPRQPNTGRGQKSSVGPTLCALPAPPLVIEPCRTGQQTFNCGVVHEGNYYYPKNSGLSSPKSQPRRPSAMETSPKQPSLDANPALWTPSPQKSLPRIQPRASPSLAGPDHPTTLTLQPCSGAAGEGSCSQQRGGTRRSSDLRSSRCHQPTKPSLGPAARRPAFFNIH